MKKLTIAICLLTTFFVSNTQAQFSVGVNTGLSGLQYEMQYGKSKILPSLGLEIGFTKPIRRHWGFVTGIGVTRFATDVTLTNSSILTENQVDDVGAAFEYRVKTTEYKEVQCFYAVTIPLMFQYHTAKLDKMQWYFNLGGKFIAPFYVLAKTTAQQLDLSGYYPDVNLEINNLQQHGFGTVNNWSNQTKYILKPSIAATAATGVSFKLGNGDKFYVGVYGVYGLNDIRKIKDLPLVTYNAPIVNGIAANSVLSTNAINKEVRIFDVGVQLKLELGRKKKVPVVKPEIVDGDKDGVPDSLDLCPCKAGCTAFRGCADTDGDGIPDNLDKCPDVKGVEKYQGCPIADKDKDGVNDEEDKCPDVAGMLKYQGCPPPDKDQDGVNDEEDKCPDVPGVAAYKGCPVPDTDGDGLNDDVDRCPTIAGTEENGGCPEIKKEVIKKANYAAKNILFQTGTATLMSSSFKGLNEVIKILEENTGMKLFIDGHTDYVGNDSFNLELSQNRANAVMDYFITKGVDASNLTATGYGKTKPIADNETPAGRQQNRRVELRLSYNE